MINQLKSFMNNLYDTIKGATYLFITTIYNLKAFLNSYSEL